MNKDRVIIDNNFLSSQNKNYIDQRVLSNNFPYYLNNNLVGEDDHKFLTHVAIQRPEDTNFNRSSSNSSEYIYLLELFNSFVEKHNINCTRVLSCVVNLSFNNGFHKTLSYSDHEFKHKNLIIYCSNNKEAKTILEKNGKSFKEIEPIKYRGVYFEDYKHSFIYPKKDVRTTIVFTFK